MPRKIVDLRALPAAAQYAIAIAVAAAVSALAWYVGRDRPRPAWLGHPVELALGVMAIVWFAYLGVRRVARRGR